MKTKLIFIFTIVLFPRTIDMFSQCISIELGVKWEREAHIFVDDSITCVPKLLITYRNNSNRNYYFLKVSDSRFGYPILPWGTLLQYPFEDYLNPDYLKRAKLHGNYANQNYYVKVGDDPFFSKGWIVEKDTIPQEHVIDMINDDLANIYEYIYRKRCSKYSDPIKGVKTYFSASDVTPDEISNTIKDRFVFLKSGEVHTDTFNLIGFKLIKGRFTFLVGRNRFKKYVLSEPKWDDNQSEYIETRILLPNKIKEYTLYSGNFNSNKLVIVF